jgi:hypothetical protein
MRRRTNARKLAEKYRLRAYALPRELERAARDLAPLLQREAVRVQERKIYSVRIPLTSSGRPMWVRTGQLKRRESGFAQGTTLVLENRTPYAVPRHVLGLPGHRQPVYTLSVQWHWEATKKLRPQILSRRRKALLKALRRP